jgi:hypothetical protein
VGMAICFKCGSAKSGALVACRNCKATPKTNSEYAISLALSDHLSTKEQLAQYSQELRNAKKLSVPREALLQAFDALKDPQLLAMLGTQPTNEAPPAQASPAPTSASPTPNRQPTSRPLQPGPDGRVTYSSGQSFDENIFKKIQPRLIEVMGLQIQKYPILLQDKTLLPKVDVQFMGIYEAMEKTHSLEQIVDESFRRAFPPNGIPQSGQGSASAPVPPTAPQRPAPLPIASRPAPRFASTTLNKSPFAVLGVTTRDDRRRIVELAEEKSLELDHELCQKARSDLTNPRTRLCAEIAWLPGVSPRKATQLVDGLLHDPMAIRQESGLPTLAHLNLMASAFETVKDNHDSDDLAEFIQEVAHRAEELYPEEVLRDINEDRAVSGFPEVKTVEQIEEELSERKRYYRNAIKEALDRLPSTKLVQVMTDTVDGATLGGEDHAPGLIDDLVDSYEVETQSPLQSGAENIHKLIQSAKTAASSGEAAVKPYVDKIEAAARSWDRIAQPIQLSAKARGTEHDLSSNLGWAIRGLALDLFNKHDILSQTQRLTALLQELFSEIPEISERAEQDADALDNIASDRNKLAEKFKDFSLSGNSFSWKNRTYDIDTISHIGFFRAITTHKTNFVETGKTEKAILTLTLSNGQTVNISIDEQGFLWNKNRAQQIQTLADFYGFLMHVTFDRRLKFYEDQIGRNGFWLYDECHFYPHKKVVFRGRDFDVDTSSFLRSYGNIELRRKDYGVLDKLKREVSLTKIPQFSTLTDTDVIFHMLDKHMGLRWNNR